jgi:hypothetical protein
VKGLGLSRFKPNIAGLPDRVLVIAAGVGFPTPRRALIRSDNFKVGDSLKRLVELAARWLRKKRSKIKLPHIKPQVRKPTGQNRLPRYVAKSVAWVVNLLVNYGLLLRVDDLKREAASGHWRLMINPEFYF